ncbi:DUF533 domain-containing protein [Coralloluteibacterium thermophilus]|uniref:DUF533 domain-containing protein n=1 Tax=Coralloluteibacterium thermophilum TaxID=2707049 RepID=A0ABV9NNB5_9GAMM
MFDPQRLLGQMFGDALGGGYGRKHGGKHRHAPRGAGALGGLLGGGKGLNKAAVGVGLLGVAYAAWEHSRQQQPGATPAAPVPGTVPPPPPGAGATPPPPPRPTGAAPTPAQQDALTLVRAMIAAAHADGLIDSEERAAILGRARDAGLDTDTLAVLERELDHPLPLERLLATARDGLGPDLYAAALVAIRVDTAAERAWLDRLAEGVGLAPETRAAIHAQLDLPPPA